MKIMNAFCSKATLQISLIESRPIHTDSIMPNVDNGGNFRASEDAAHLAYRSAGITDRIEIGLATQTAFIPLSLVVLLIALRL